jgi:signal transduction histidine kinase
MTVISGYVQLMADAEDPAQRQEFSELILKQFDVLTAMQREVLEFARGDRALFVRRVYLKKFFAELEKQLRIEVGHSGGAPIELKAQVDSKLTARFDEARVARALHNLARNAIEAMGDRAAARHPGRAQAPAPHRRLGHRLRNSQGDRGSALSIVRHGGQEAEPGSASRS